MKGLFLLVVLLTCAPAADAASDLGAEANVWVKRAFSAYQRRHPEGACRAAGPGRRVLLTGYGPFGGDATNLSGTIVRSMAEEAFWPSNVKNISSAQKGPAEGTDGRIRHVDNGGAAFNRSLKIEGRDYEFCFLVLDVTWELAGAIVVHEMAAFKPELVMMMGAGTSRVQFEAFAVNRAGAHPGYDSEGRSFGRANRPIGLNAVIIEGYPSDFMLPMTWNSGALAQAVRPDVLALGYESAGMTRPMVGNDYLCNELSFIALHASYNFPTSLAGGLIELRSPEVGDQPIVGFLHLPNAPTSTGNVFSWSKVIARAAQTALSDR